VAEAIAQYFASTPDFVTAFSFLFF